VLKTHWPWIVVVGTCAATAHAQHPAPEAELVGAGVVSTLDNEFGPAFEPDGKTLYFTKTDPARSKFQVIVVSHERGGQWSEPEVASFSGLYKDIDPSLSPDGKTLVFASNRPVTGTEPKKDYDLWAVDRTANGWGEPRHLGALVNGEGSETTTSQAADGTLYFASDNRPGGKGKRDLYRARLAHGRYAQPEPIVALNTEADDSNHYVAPDQSYLIFGSDRAGGLGSFDFYVSHNRNGEWTLPSNLGAKVNTGANVLTPTVSPDGRYLYFAAFRGFADAFVGRRLAYREILDKIRSPANGLGDIYRIELAALAIEAPAR
jgi:Tol biopolymer transport system component